MEQNSERIEYLESEIRACKLFLSQSDYQCMKYADGALSEEEYADMKAKRQTWRDHINAYQAEIETLEAADTSASDAEASTQS